MGNEFYNVNLDDGENYYFKNKDNAFNFLWQVYLDNCADRETDEQIKEAKHQLYEFYLIDGVGIIYVVGFED